MNRNSTREDASETYNIYKKMLECCSDQKNTDTNKNEILIYTNQNVKN